MTLSLICLIYLKTFDLSNYKGNTVCCEEFKYRVSPPPTPHKCIHNRLMDCS